MHPDAPNILFHGKDAESFFEAVTSDLSSFYGDSHTKTPLSSRPYLKIVSCLRDQSINYVRKEISFFAKMVVKTPLGLRKTLILCDAEHLSHEAQSALRRYIELNNHTTRFIITTRLPNHILSPIRSRFKLIHLSNNNASELDNRHVSTSPIKRMSSSSLLDLAEEYARAGKDNSELRHILSAESLLLVQMLRQGCREDKLLTLYGLVLAQCPGNHSFLLPE
jgi:hypothetical protein